MRRGLVAFGAGFVLASAARLGLAAHGSEPSRSDRVTRAADVEQGPSAPPPRLARPAAVEPTPREEAARPDVDRAPDLIRGDELVGYLVGDPIAWDSEAERDAMAEGLRAVGAEYEAAGYGRLLQVDCQHYPCIALFLERPEHAYRWEHFAGMFTGPHIWGDAEEGGAGLLVVQPYVSDVAPFEPHLATRKQQLLFSWGYPWVRPTDAGVAELIVWPDVQR